MRLNLLALGRGWLKTKSSCKNLSDWSGIISKEDGAEWEKEGSENSAESYWGKEQVENDTPGYGAVKTCTLKRFGRWRNCGIRENSSILNSSCWGNVRNEAELFVFLIPNCVEIPQEGVAHKPVVGLVHCHCHQTFSWHAYINIEDVIGRCNLHVLSVDKDEYALQLSNITSGDDVLIWINLIVHVVECCFHKLNEHSLRDIDKRGAGIYNGFFHISYKKCWWVSRGKGYAFSYTESIERKQPVEWINEGNIGNASARLKLSRVITSNGCFTLLGIVGNVEAKQIFSNNTLVIEVVHHQWTIGKSCSVPWATHAHNAIYLFWNTSLASNLIEYGIRGFNYVVNWIERDSVLSEKSLKRSRTIVLVNICSAMKLVSCAFRTLKQFTDTIFTGGVLDN